MHKLIPVDNAVGLVRDAATGAVLDNRETEKALLMKNRARKAALETEVTTQAEQINKLEQEMMRLSAQLSSILNKDNTPQ